jgi:hypothetical protein
MDKINIINKCTECSAINKKGFLFPRYFCKKLSNRKILNPSNIPVSCPHLSLSSIVEHLWTLNNKDLPKPKDNVVQTKYHEIIFSLSAENINDHLNMQISYIGACSQCKGFNQKKNCCSFMENKQITDQSQLPSWCPLPQVYTLFRHLQSILD